MAREMDPNDLRGIESWYKQHREWVKAGRPEKYTEAEKDAIAKKCKVGKYSETKDKVYRYTEIVNELQQKNKDTYRLKVFTWVKRNHPHKAHLSWEELVEQGVHTQMYTGKKKEEHLEEELEDVDFM
jgi:hypothetical protein